jgi:Acetyltransferase (GNAT) domain
VKVVADQVLKFLESAPLFFQPWWLEAVSPGSWDYAVVRRGEDVAAVLPYTFKVKLNRLRLIEMPRLTPYLGPWLRPSTAKYANRLGEEKDLMTELIDALPPFAAFQQDFHPSITNWLPFHWKGFSETTRYTYRMDATNDLDALWSETRDNVRTDIKKAKKQVEITDAGDIGSFLKLHRLTFARQNKPLPHSEEMLRGVDAACVKNGARKILTAIDAAGRAHAAVYLVTDAHAVYYLLSGSDAELRNSGAISWLLWEGIRWASAMGKPFDFEGSMVEPIERSFRAFGGRQVRYFGIEKCDSAIVKLYRTAWRWTHRAK